MIHPTLHRALSDALGSSVASSQPLSGGDINDAYAIALDDGRELFLKTNDGAPTTMFPAEARGLGWLDDARALPVPKVVAVNAEETRGPCFLVLELMKPGNRVADFDERLGRGLAALHRSRAPSFGLESNNFIGSLPQTNTPHTHWHDFYHERRLDPLVRLAQRRGLIDRETHRDFDRLYEVLPERVGPEEPPARLHGDLWGGNLHGTAAGEPALIDPAVYGGHREIDLAMMRLFGGFSESVFSAYHETYPLAPDATERVPLYQLYPLLVHVNLFGRGYLSGVKSALARLL